MFINLGTGALQTDLSCCGLAEAAVGLLVVYSFAWRAGIMGGTQERPAGLGSGLPTFHVQGHSPQTVGVLPKRCRIARLKSSLSLQTLHIKRPLADTTVDKMPIHHLMIKVRLAAHTLSFLPLFRLVFDRICFVCGCSQACCDACSEPFLVVWLTTVSFAQCSGQGLVSGPRLLSKSLEAAGLRTDWRFWHVGRIHSPGPAWKHLREARWVCWPCLCMKARPRFEARERFASSSSHRTYSPKRD